MNLCDVDIYISAVLRMFNIRLVWFCVYTYISWKCLCTEHDAHGELMIREDEEQNCWEAK
jgi:hypothetical protein